MDYGRNMNIRFPFDQFGNEVMNICQSLNVQYSSKDHQTIPFDLDSLNLKASPCVYSSIRNSLQTKCLLFSDEIKITILVL